ncbi:MAG: hypothetical protein KGL63_08790, partial [Betaproteobacteria bacterium]|nr:hypothetical protein [Betaproteobacteria bacterium]
QSTTASVEVEQLRDVWGGLTNRALEREGVGERVDHRSLAAQREGAMERSHDQARPEPERQAAEREAQDLDREPTVHLGPAASALERRGQNSERGDQMRAVQGRNEERAGLWQQVREWGAQALDKAREWGADLAQSLKGLDLSPFREASLAGDLRGLDLSGFKAAERQGQAQANGHGLGLPGNSLNPLKALSKGQEKQQGQAVPGPKISRDDGPERSRSDERSQEHRRPPAKSRDFGWER